MVNLVRIYHFARTVRLAGVNPSIAGANISTLWISVGGIPALNPAVLLKPLYWGFLLLGTERGFSVLWVLRFLLLFLVSFEFAMRYTERENHGLALLPP